MENAFKLKQKTLFPHMWCKGR